jgi:hypothetical protein
MTDGVKAVDTGGSAYPTPDVYHPNGQIQYGETGISARDYFAAAALTGLLADTRLQVPRVAFVKEAYAYADLMIAERKK